MIRSFLVLLKFIVIFLFIVLFSVFASNNTTFVELNLSPFGYAVEVRLFLLVLISFVLGMMATMILTCLRRLFGFIDFNDFFYRRKIRNLERRIKEFKNNRIDDNKFEIKNDDKKD